MAQRSQLLAIKLPHSEKGTNFGHHIGAGCVDVNAREEEKLKTISHFEWTSIEAANWSVN